LAFVQGKPVQPRVSAYTFTTALRHPTFHHLTLAPQATQKVERCWCLLAHRADRSLKVSNRRFGIVLK
jgi:hypothetical protein